MQEQANAVLTVFRVRGIAPRVDEDRALSTDIECVAEAIRNGQFDSADDRL
jgi:histidine ammonia-lyase